MSAAWGREEDLDEEGRRWGYPDPRPLRLEEWVLVGLLVSMLAVCLALAGGAWQ